MYTFIIISLVTITACLCIFRKELHDPGVLWGITLVVFVLNLIGNIAVTGIVGFQLPMEEYVYDTEYLDPLYFKWYDSDSTKQKAYLYSENLPDSLLEEYKLEYNLDGDIEEIKTARIFFLESSDTIPRLEISKFKRKTDSNKWINSFMLPYNNGHHSFYVPDDSVHRVMFNRQWKAINEIWNENIEELVSN